MIPFPNASALSSFALFITMAAIGFGLPPLAHGQPDATPAAPVALSLDESVRLALRQSPDVLLARLDQQEAELKARQVGDPFSLKLGVGSGLAWTSGFPMNVGGSGPSLVNAQASMTLYDRPLRYRIAEARERAKAEALTEAEKRSAVALEVTRLFLEAESLGLAEESLQAEIASLERVLGIRERQLEEGRALPLDTKRAKVSLAAARYRLREMESTVKQSQARIGFLLGFESGREVAPVRGERRQPELPADPQAAAAVAVEGSPEVERLKVFLAANQFRVKGANAIHWPVIRLVSQYSMFARFNNYDDFYNRFERHNGQIGASFELPLFTGSATRAERSQAGIEADRLRLNLETARRKVALEASAATRLAQDAKAYHELIALDLEAARDQVSVLLAQANEGKARLEDLELARTEENRKWVEYYRSRASAEQAAYDLLHKTGRLVAWFQ
ncbi:MAG: TolC family protein [Bryobacterales bacterium]|nr:TolC family protein [Bryobacterales bacterium]